MKYKSEHAQAEEVYRSLACSSGGANFNAAYNSAKLNTAQVENQTSVDVGKGGMDVVVKGNTHLEGAVISSQADKADNRFQTGTLTTKDIQNHSELKRKAWQSTEAQWHQPNVSVKLLGNKNESSFRKHNTFSGRRKHWHHTHRRPECRDYAQTAESRYGKCESEGDEARPHRGKRNPRTYSYQGIGEIADKAMQIYTQ